MSSNQFRFDDTLIIEESETQLVTTSFGVVLFFAAIFLLTLSVGSNLVIFVIPSISILVVFIFNLLRFYNTKVDVKVKVTFPTTQIRAKTFLPTLVEIHSSRDILGVLSVTPSSGLFPVTTSTTRLVKLKKDQTVNTTFLFYAPRRGKEFIKSISLQFNGAYGLFYTENTINPNRMIVVTPEPQRIQIPWTMKQKILDDLISSISIPIKGKGSDFLSLRDFQFGDDIRHIHWKASAKYDKIIVKEYEEPKRLRFLLIVDATTFMAGPKLEFALSAAIELGHVIQRSEHSVKILVFNYKESKYVELTSSPASIRTLGLTLHNVLPEGVNLNYRTLLQTVKSRGLIDTVAVFLSDVEQDPQTVREGILAIRPWVQRLYYFAMYSPGFGTTALKSVRDENALSMDEIRYRREILEKKISRKYNDVVQEFREIVMTNKGKFHLVESYNTNILLELKKALELELSIMRKERILGGIKNA